MEINTQLLTWAINDLAKKKKITKTFLADKIGVSRDTLTRWAKGKSAPKEEQLDALVFVLNISKEGFIKKR